MTALQRRCGDRAAPCAPHGFCRCAWLFSALPERGDRAPGDKPTWSPHRSPAGMRWYMHCTRWKRPRTASSALRFAAREFAQDRPIKDLFAIQSRIIEHLRLVLNDPATAWCRRCRPMRRGCTGCFIPRSRSSRRCGPRVRPTPRARRISSGAASPAPSMRARRWSCCMTPRRCVNACRWACSTARRPPAWTLPFRWSSWNANSPHCRCRGATKALPGALTRTARTVDALYATPLPSGDLLQALDGLYLLDDGQAIEELRERQRATFQQAPGAAASAVRSTALTRC